jgi:L-arabinose transport system substrate-binding protein
MKKLLILLLCSIFSISIIIGAIGCKTEPVEEVAEEVEEAEEEVAEEVEEAEEEVAEEVEEAEEALDLTFGYVCKRLESNWFVIESAGIEKFCDEMGIEYIAADAKLEEERFLELVDQLILQGVDALMVVPPSPQIGPAITKKCEDAGIPVMTIDDPIIDHYDNPVPHIGMPTREVGILGGEALSELAKERGFFDDGNVVKVANASGEKVPVWMERTEGFTQGLLDNTPLEAEDIIFVETEDTYIDNALPAVTSTVSLNPDATHWIATGPNDDAAIAAIRAFESLGIEPTNYLACGLGGYSLALEEFDKGNDSFITVGLRPDLEGYQAAEILYNYLVNGVPMPELTFVGGTILTVDNYKELSPFYEGE